MGPGAEQALELSACAAQHPASSPRSCPGQSGTIPAPLPPQHLHERCRSWRPELLAAGTSAACATDSAGNCPAARGPPTPSLARAPAGRDAGLRDSRRSGAAADALGAAPRTRRTSRAPLASPQAPLPPAASLPPSLLLRFEGPPHLPQFQRSNGPISVTAKA
eukprot:scaffold186_cov257-Pinguiococcus_pyrenoidosus.AAC.4